MTLRRAQGGAQFPYVETVAGYATTSDNNPGNGTAYWFAVRVAKPTPITSMVLSIGTGSAGNVDVGIYTTDGTTMTKVASTGSTAVGAGPSQTIALTAAYMLQPGQTYYFAFVADSGTPTFSRANSNKPAAGALGNRSLTKASVNIPLPTSQAISGCTAFNLPYWIAGI